MSHRSSRLLAAFAGIVALLAGAAVWMAPAPADAFSAFKNRFSKQCYEIEITGVVEDLVLSDWIRAERGVPSGASWSWDRDVCVEIAEGAVVTASDASRPAIAYGPDLGSDIQVLIENEGSILGRGGQGGRSGRGGGSYVANWGACPQKCEMKKVTVGGKDAYEITKKVCTPLPCAPAFRPSTRANGGDGQDGGAALLATRPTVLKNRGLVAGGGGGGGGGAGGSCYQCYDDFGASGGGGSPLGAGGAITSDVVAGSYTNWEWVVSGGALDKRLAGGRPMNGATYCYLGDPGQKSSPGGGGRPCAHDVSSEWGSAHRGGRGGGPGEAGARGGGNYPGSCQTYQQCSGGKDENKTCRKMWYCIPSAIGGDGGAPGQAIRNLNLVEIRERGTISPRP